MKHTPLASGILAIVLAASPAGAQSELTVGAAVARALDRGPALAAARARVAQAEETVGEARSDHGPLIAASALGALHGEPVPVTPIHGFGLEQFPEFDDTLVQGQVQVDYTLLDSGRRRYKVEQADARLAAERAALDADEQATAAQIASLYARVLADRHGLEAQSARVGALRAELDRVSQRLAVGRAPEVERLRAEAALAAASADATRAATALDLDERALARLIGELPDATRADRLVALPAPPAPARPRAELEAAAVAASADLVAARSALRAAEAGRALAHAAYYPKLGTSGVFQQLGGSDLLFSTEWSASLKLTVPLWDGGATDRRVARAAAARDEAGAAVDLAELRARDAVDRALGAWTDAAARGEALAAAEQRLVEVVRVERLLLDVGSGTQTDYLTAEAELAATRAELARTRSEAVAARVELARATGEISLDWIVLYLEAPR